jgi:hypothetical protein
MTNPAKANPHLTVEDGGFAEGTTGFGHTTDLAVSGQRAGEVESS